MVEKFPKFFEVYRDNKGAAPKLSRQQRCSTKAIATIKVQHQSYRDKQRFTILFWAKKILRSKKKKKKMVFEKCEKNPKKIENFQKIPKTHFFIMNPSQTSWAHFIYYGRGWGVRIQKKKYLYFLDPKSSILARHQKTHKSNCI